MSTKSEIDIKFGWRKHGIPAKQVTEDNFDDLPPMQQMLRIGVTHGCPNPIRVALEIGLDIFSKSKDKSILNAVEEAQKWLIERQLECNKEWNNILRMTEELNPPLHELLIKPESRKPNELVGEYNPRLVSKDYGQIMPPGSTPGGYELARIRIEQMGRGDARTQQRMERADELTREAIQLSSTPVEFISNLASLVVTNDFGGKGDADAMAVLSQTLSETNRKEQGCTSIFREIAVELKGKSPKLWDYYISLDSEALQAADIVNPALLFSKITFFTCYNAPVWNRLAR